MTGGLRPIRSWLYVPGNAPRRIEKSFTLGADAVVFDLEDAVPPQEKLDARKRVCEAIDASRERSQAPVFVRVNAVSTEWFDDDLAAVTRRGIGGIRLPKSESASDVTEVAERLGTLEQENGLPPNSVHLVCGIESALGLTNAVTIAAASTRVLALSFGAADFARDLGLTPTPGRTETLFARSQLVVASRVATVRPPVDSAHLGVADLQGLERTTREAKSLGYFGRSVIHPDQIAVVNDVFTPSGDQVARAREIVDAAGRAARVGGGALLLPDGEFVDVAIVRRAQDILTLAQALAEVPR